ncbi:MAG: DUF4238 domain-containing protein [Tissierellia bacterium]|nr:DUF4238 domain-containing protein [Tissierellia bacterium]
MAHDHIIPRFVLKGFALNPEASANKQEVMIYYKATKEIIKQKISAAYAIRDFNSPETETLLAKEYENKVAMIFQRIKKRAADNEKDVVLSNEEYKLLFRFFTIMWRRNDIQLEKAKELFLNEIREFEKILEKLSGKKAKDMLKDKYKNISYEEMFDSKQEDLRIPLYDKIILQTTIDDPTVQKTLTNYFPAIILNNSDTHFLLHNTYATNLHLGPVINEEYPQLMICPISKNLCFYLMLSIEKIDLTKETYKLPIDIYSDDVIKEMFIKKYIIKTATSFVVDETNYNLIKDE